MILAILQLISILTFAIGAGILSGLFSVNESKDVVTVASKIHGAGAAIGFMTLLFFPLLSAILALKMGDIAFGIVLWYFYLWFLHGIRNAVYYFGRTESK